MVKVKVKRDFSNTIFGNVSQKQILTITEKRAEEWERIGLVERIKPKIPNFNSMTKADLEAYAKAECGGVDLDMRKSKDKLVEEVTALVKVMK